MSKRDDGKNRYLGAYDRPLAKDWAFWLHLGFTLFSCIALAVPTSERPADGSTPVWFDVIVGGPLMGFLFIYPIALIRRLVRGIQERRARSVANARAASQAPYPPPVY